MREHPANLAGLRDFHWIRFTEPRRERFPLPVDLLPPGGLGFVILRQARQEPLVAAGGGVRLLLTTQKLAHDRMSAEAVVTAFHTQHQRKAARFEHQVEILVFGHPANGRAQRPAHAADGRRAKGEQRPPPLLALGGGTALQENLDGEPDAGAQVKARVAAVGMRGVFGQQIEDGFQAGERDAVTQLAPGKVDGQRQVAKLFQQRFELAALGVVAGRAELPCEQVERIGGVEDIEWHRRPALGTAEPLNPAADDDGAAAEIEREKAGGFGGAVTIHVLYVQQRAWGLQPAAQNGGAVLRSDTGHAQTIAQDTVKAAGRGGSGGIEREADVATGELVMVAAGEFVAEVGFADAGQSVDGADGDGGGVGGEQGAGELIEFGDAADEDAGGWKVADDGAAGFARDENGLGGGAAHVLSVSAMFSEFLDEELRLEAGGM